MALGGLKQILVTHRLASIVRVPVPVKQRVLGCEFLALLRLPE